MISLCADVTDLNDCALSNLMLNRHAPELGLFDFNILVHVPQFHRGQVLSPDRLTEGAKILVGHHGVATCVGGRAGIANDSTGRRIEAGVIGHVAEVTLVADAVPAAKAVLAIAENVV